MSDLEILMLDLKSYDELRLMELVYDIEDFAQSLWIPGASGPVLSFIGMDPREDYVETIKSFQKKIQALEKQQQKSTGSKPDQGGDSSPDATSSSDPASPSAAGGYTPEASLVGIDEPKMMLLDLLKKPASGDQDGGQDAVQRPKVICIVGCPGVGKTAPARAVYDHHAAGASRDFDCVAWVEASGCNNRTALLGKILQEVQADLASRASAIQRLWGILQDMNSSLAEGDGIASSQDLQGILAGKRYLVFLDDVQQANMWKDIVRDFPENAKSSMLIVTTSIHSVADVYSSGSYVYTMQCLPQDKSEDLFWRKVYGYQNKPGRALCNGSESIIRKCDGLPLALISVAGHLSIKANKLDCADCVNVGEELGSHYLAGIKAEEEFRNLRRALGRCYEGLPGYDHKAFMLSLSIFPRNHPIKIKSLVRRLIAEGLIAGDDKGYMNESIKFINWGRECLAQLIDRCIVDPVRICSWSKDVKSCQVNGGIMLEFIIYTSQSTNLVTLIREEEVVRNNKGRIRRLSVQSSAEEKFQEVVRNIGLSDIRSLTILSGNLSFPSRKNSLSDAIRSLTIIPSEERSELFDIQNCKFLRLLDLEGCRGLDEELFAGICKLVYLKYLSLRNTDFVLPEMSDNTRKFLKDKSELHTVAGLVVDPAKGYEIILEARKLKKVKVWCRDITQMQMVEEIRRSITHITRLSE
ncbi:hypothetical protein EJB05_25841, partial [Eragrostis curvula]